MLLKSDAYHGLLQAGRSAEEAAQLVAGILNDSYLRGLAIFEKERHDTLFAEAQESKAQRQYSDALDLYGQVLEINPVNVEAHIGTGDCLQGLRRHAEAATAYERALDLRPGDGDVLLAKARSERDADHLAEAVRTYRTAISEARPPAGSRADRWGYNVRRELVDALFRQANWQAALNEIGVLRSSLRSRAPSGQHEEGAALLGLEAFAFTKLGQYKTALERHEEARRLDGDYVAKLPGEVSGFLDGIGPFRSISYGVSRLWSGARNWAPVSVVAGGAAAVLAAILLTDAVLLSTQPARLWVVAAASFSLVGIVGWLLSLDLRTAPGARAGWAFLTVAALVGSAYATAQGLPRGFEGRGSSPFAATRQPPSRVSAVPGGGRSIAPLGRDNRTRVPASSSQRGAERPSRATIAAVAPVRAWVTTPGFGRLMREVWCDMPIYCFAVGDGGEVLLFDGPGWTRMSTPTSADLKAIWGFSHTDVFAVGNSGVILRYDGNTWTQMRSGTTNHLLEVWGPAPNVVFAGGVFGTLLRYDGVSWSEMATPTTQDLWGLWGSSWSNVYAVGGSGRVLHYDGSEWRVQPVGRWETLFAVWGSSASNVFAVGGGGTVLHFDGATWSRMSSGTTAILNDIWGSGPQDVYAVGSRGVIIRFDGIRWTAMSSGTGLDLSGVHGSGGPPADVFAVGSNRVILRGRR
ncbi:MAG: tetratricopeptide repeat protein [Gemmatimonadetes bacterium]|nr:tetratricopeptide repeat protein [Gemmatimonadota bacterium]